MEKKLEIELDDDAVVKAIFNHYVGHTFPVMQMFYDNGKYIFTGYEPAMTDVTPEVPQLTYGGATFG